MNAIYKVFTLAFSIVVLWAFPTLANPIDAGYVVLDFADPLLRQLVIERQDKDFNTDPRVLFNGDKLSGVDIDKLKKHIQPNPGFKIIDLEPSKIQIALDPFMEDKSLAQRIIDFFVAHEEDPIISINSTRGGALFKQCPQPGFFATLLFGQSTKFAWTTPANRFVIIDSKGNNIFQKEMVAQTGLELKPEEMNLKPGNLYVWKINSSNEEYKIVVLDEAKSFQIREDLMKFDMTGSEQVTKLRKIAYLQLLSDKYPETIDLYWLSYQLASEINTKDGKIISAVERFIERVAVHLDAQLYYKAKL